MEDRLKRMMDEYGSTLLRTCTLILKDRHLAQDAVQETFIKAYRNLNRFAGHSSVKTWLNRIAINTCKDMCKTGWFRHMDRRITPDMLPETETIPEEKDESLTIAIMGLPIKLREVALLCWLQGFTYLEAADALGISHQAVSSRLNRARGKLRSVLEGSDDHDPA